jgi:two-component system, OmpR family, response regulator
MLVLSRRADQQILFPNLDIKLQVLQVRGKVVKIGIEAPDHVRILRPEVADRYSHDAPAPPKAPGVDRHQLRNHLNTINLALHLFQKQSDAGLSDDAERSFQRVLDELRQLDAEIGAGKARVQEVAAERPPRLLVVEDDDNERELLTGLLRLHGFEVESAVDGRAALDYLESHDAPDYVLLDMMMPRLDGAQAIDRIRGNERLAQMKVFAVSGTSPQEMGVPSGPEGFDGWFPKPVDPERLIRVIGTSDRTHVQTLA